MSAPAPIHFRINENGEIEQNQEANLQRWTGNLKGRNVYACHFYHEKEYFYYLDTGESNGDRNNKWQCSPTSFKDYREGLNWIQQRAKEPGIDMEIGGHRATLLPVNNIFQKYIPISYWMVFYLSK